MAVTEKENHPERGKPDLWAAIVCFLSSVDEGFQFFNLNFNIHRTIQITTEIRYKVRDQEGAEDPPRKWKLTILLCKGKGETRLRE